MVSKGLSVRLMYGVETQPDIDRAIRRSRSVRAAMRSRRRRSVALAACLSLGAAGISTLSLVGMTGDDIVHAAVSQAKSLAELLNGRSPGGRTQGELTKTKHARSLAKSRIAARHPAKKQIPGPLVPATANLVGLAPILAAPPPVAPVNIAQSFPQIPIGAPPTLGVIVGSLPGADLGPPAGDKPVSFPSTEPKDVVPPVTPLPEPGTWATMLLGFAFIGWRVRYGRKAGPSRLPA